MSSFIRLLLYFWVYCKGYFIVAFILCKLISAVYLWATDYNKWWLGILPFGHVYYKIELAGISPVLMSFYVVLCPLSLVDYNVYLFAIAMILDIISNYKFADMYIDNGNPWLYSCLPFAKYVIMIKEVISNERIKSR